MDANIHPPTLRPVVVTRSRRSLVLRAAALLSLGFAANQGGARGLVRLLPWLQQHKDNPTLVGQHKDNPT
jgi:hypothetical protein